MKALYATQVLNPLSKLLPAGKSIPEFVSLAAHTTAIAAAQKWI